MRKEYEEKYHALEQGHWWFKARRDIIAKLLEPAPRESRILDVGCSGGALLKFLVGKGYRNAAGIDKSKRAVAKCRQRGLGNVKLGNAAATGLKPGFDVVIASDILEHIEKEAAALKEWNRLLKKGGMLLVFVPAFKFLWSGHDTANRHFRRYKRQDLVEKLEKAGFEVVRASYWNFLLFFPIALMRLVGAGGDQLRESGGLSNRLLLRLLLLENALLSKGPGFPFGVSVFAVAVKR